MAVRALETLNPRMLRIVLGGPELAGLVIDEPAASVRLLVPPPGRREIVMPTWTGNQFELPTGERAPIRTFTPRLFDPGRAELTIDLVLHGRGAASDWATATGIGDEVAVSGPGRGYVIDPAAATTLLVGDESAIPAISQLLESIPFRVHVDVRIEVADDAARAELPGHPNANTVWYTATPGSQPGDQLVGAVASLETVPDAVWVAGEAAAVQRIRRNLFEERGIERSRASVHGYWKHGRSAT